MNRKNFNTQLLQLIRQNTNETCAFNFNFLSFLNNALEDTALNTNELEIDNSIENRVMTTKLQAMIGGLIGKNIIQNESDHNNKFNGVMFMHTKKPCTPLSLIKEEVDTSDSIFSKEFFGNDKIMSLVLNRSAAIKNFLDAQQHFIALYSRPHDENTMKFLEDLTDQYDTLHLHHIDDINDDLHGAFYIVNENNNVTMIFVNSCQISSGSKQFDHIKIVIKKHLDIINDKVFQKIINILKNQNINLLELLGI